jgi:negative regulator of sigma E activity
LADKVLKSLSGDASVGTPQYGGHSAFVAKAVRLLLGRAQPSLAAAQVSSAVSMLVQHAHSGAIGGVQHPTLGAYNGELKPAKKTDTKSLTKVSRETVSVAVDIYQARVLVRLLHCSAVC